VTTITQQLLIDEAKRRAYPVEKFGQKEEFLSITMPNGESELLLGSRPMASSANGRKIAVNKLLTLQFVETCGFRVPAYQLLKDEADALQFLHKHQSIVIKPLDSSGDRGVTANITSPEQAATAFAYAKLHSSSDKVLAQVYLSGKLYRLLVIDGRMVAAVERTAARVFGDGTSSLRQLVESINDQPKRNGKNAALGQIYHSDMHEYLGGDMLESVPFADEEVRLNQIQSVSRGGEAVNVTHEVHSSWSEAASRITKRLGLVIAGFDIICEDIGQPLASSYFPLLEINSMPGFKLHEYPTGGDAIHVAPILFDALAG
jgi:cyanophycin synthetase